VRNDSTAMRTVAILTLTFLPATFVSVRTMKRYALRPRIRALLLAYNVLGYFQYQFLQLHSYHRVRQTIVDRIGQILDLLDICYSSHDCHNHTLVYLAAPIRLKVRLIRGLLLEDSLSRRTVRARISIWLRCHDWIIGRCQACILGHFFYGLPGCLFL
jgi:hypothetical protein